MPKPEIETKNIVSGVYLIGGSDTSSGSSLIGPVSVKNVRVSRETEQSKLDLYAINKRLSSEYVSTGDSASRERIKA